MTDKKLAANRKNALKSTGPRTLIGKAVSSRNAVKHGVLATAPILLAIESRKAWEGHRDGIFKSIAPVGYLEEQLTFQIVELSWRIGRVFRYEAEMSAVAGARTEAELPQRDENGWPVPSEPEWASQRIRGESVVIETLEVLPKLSDAENLDTESMAAALSALWLEFSNEVNLEDIRLSRVPVDDAEPNAAFNCSTARFLRKAVERYAGAVGISSEAVLKRCVSSARKKRSWAIEKERELVERRLVLEQKNQSRMQLKADHLVKLARYESNLQRAFFRTLHEIQRLQASRSGVVVPPPTAVDVDVSFHPESSRRAHLQKRTPSHKRVKQSSTRCLVSELPKPFSEPRLRTGSRARGCETQRDAHRFREKSKDEIAKRTHYLAHK